MNYWTAREKGVVETDWYIVVVGSDNIEYIYDGETKNIDNSSFVDEINEQDND